MYLTYDDYHKMVYELLFNDTTSGNTEYVEDSDNSNDSNTVNTIHGDHINQ